MAGALGGITQYNIAGSISGRITDTNYPYNVSGAYVIVLQNYEVYGSDVTNSYGLYEVSNLEAGTYGGFTRASFLKPVIEIGAVVVTRLRKDAMLYAEPKPPKQRKCGRPRKYGKRIKLANCVTHPDGWFTIKAILYGRQETKEVKRFKAVYKPAGCLIQVLVVRERSDCFRAFICTDLTASAMQILEAVADRYAIEQNFCDLKEIEGAGQQQVRTLGSNIGTFHLNLWFHSLVELWAWDKSAKVLCDRRDSPWDDVNRRPSHADKCAALRRAVLKQTFFSRSGTSHEVKKIHKQFYKLLKLVA
ncbi:MAG: hypothetical protein JXA82_17720 [Sedimentisphaerales bacterium]|nr:hypothetical protein [Sedimentisphaerales bacterium]